MQYNVNYVNYPEHGEHSDVNMALVEEAKLEGECFQEAVRQVCYFFQVENLFEDQVKAIKAFFKGNNVFFCASTGYGKSIVFQSIPLFADILLDQLVGTSTAIVVCPLISLMLDQVNKVNKLGINAAALFQGQDEAILKDIEDGYYSLVFTSPESMFATKRWEKMWKSKCFVENCICVAVDEAHCISQWGLAGPKIPFRTWYGNLGVIRSLFKDVSLIVCTATATKATKSKIFDVLELKKEETFNIEKSPERPNLVYSIQYIENDLEFSDVFNEVIQEVKDRKVKCTKTLVYCQTRKQAAIIWRTFKVALGKDMYAGETMLQKDCIVEMYHAGTPESSKKHILKSVSLPNGHVRVLICTIAFGMGIDLKGARKVIHFGPSQTTECYLQECGRVGRDGGQSLCILLYNGFLASRCSVDMKELISEQKCHRREILKHFPGNHEITVEGCQCCNVYALTCLCSGLKGECSKNMLLNFSSNRKSYQYEKHRTVTNEQKTTLESKLCEYRDVLRSKTPKQVLYPNVYVEFGALQIFQVVDNASKLFSLSDIMDCVEIWRSEHASGVLNIVSQIFGDIDIGELSIDLDDDDLDETVDSDWLDIRDDSSANVLLFQDGSLFQVSQEMSELDRSAGSPLDTSTEIRDIATEVFPLIDADDMEL